MKKRSYSKWALKSFGLKLGSVYMKPDTAMMILTVCIPHLVEIEAAFMNMWREEGSTWMANDLTRESLATYYNLVIGPTGLEKKEKVTK